MSIILTPFSLLLKLFYNLTANYGLALILFAIVVKAILFPFSLKGKKSMVRMNAVSAKAAKLQKQYGNNREKYSEELQKLYAKENVNPMGGCLWSLIPLFILLPLYAIIRQPMQYMMGLSAEQVTAVANALDWGNVAFQNGWIKEVMEYASTATGYKELFLTSLLSVGGNLDVAKNAVSTLSASAVATAEGMFAINFNFLGIDLSQVPTWKFWTSTIDWNHIGLFLMPIISAGLSLVMSFVSQKTNNISGEQQAQQQNMMMMYVMMPLMSLWIGYSMPAGLCVYWIINSLTSIAQEFICSKMLKKDYEAAREEAKKQALLDKEEEKRRKAALNAERAKRAEEKKKAKKAEKAASGNGEVIAASRVGIRSYARGRAYDPDRYPVTEYKDPNCVIDEDAVEKARQAKADKAEEAKLEADVTAKVAAEMDALNGATAEEVAENIAEAAETTEAASESVEETPAEETAKEGEEND